MSITKVCLTGGPCGGKTTALQRISKEFREKGYYVIVVKEAATELIESGMKPFGEDAISIYDFQKLVMDKQIHSEKLAEMAARMKNKDTIIICDRGLGDDKAYVNSKEYVELLKEFNLTEQEAINRYDLVIHLTTAALGAEEFYTLANNAARTETVEEARYKDKLTLNAWLGCKNLKIMGNETSFEEKMQKTVNEIYKYLDKPYPIKRQKKYLVSSIDIDKINDYFPVKQEIEQVIKGNLNAYTIYRKTNSPYGESYTEIKKLDTVDHEKIVVQKNMSENDYIDKVKDKKALSKIRYTFAYKNAYYKLDIFDKDLIILEVEETNKSKTPIIPDFLKVIEDVTDKEEYQNITLYKNLNKNRLQKQKVIND